MEIALRNIACTIGAVYEDDKAFGVQYGSFFDSEWAFDKFRYYMFVMQQKMFRSYFKQMGY